MALISSVLSVSAHCLACQAPYHLSLLNAYNSLLFFSTLVWTSALLDLFGSLEHCKSCSCLRTSASVILLDWQITLQFSSWLTPSLYYFSWFCGLEIWAELNWAVLPFLMMLMWVTCWYSAGGWSGLAGLRWPYSYVSLWAGTAGRLWKVLEGQALLRSLTSHLGQGSQNKCPKR